MTVELITRYVKILIAFVLLWTGIWFFNSFGCNRIDGNEMAPTLPAEKNALIDPKVRQPGELNRDDIVAYTYQFGGRSGTKKVTARVVGLPGDRVKMVKGEVFVNGEKHGSGGGEKKAADDYAEIIVPRGTVFVLCDNRSAKDLDSRKAGPIGTWAILGRLR